MFVIIPAPFLHHNIICFIEPCKENHEKHDKLNNLVKEFEFGDDWSDECDYVEEEDIREIVIENSDLSVIQLNIRGLFGKQDKLLKLINCCNKSKIDIIILEETWLNKKNQNEINIPGYEFIGQA